MERTEEAKLALGNYCEALMREDQFNDLWREFKHDNVELMLNTQPQEFKKRESIYAEMNGFQAFINLMAGYVSARDQIIERNNPPSTAISDDEQRDVDYL